MDQQTRQEFIRAAVSFLQNPKLIDSPLQDKLKFLRDKGLTEVELDEALNYALISRHQSQSGKWNFILILGLCIGGYKLYQAYLKSSQAEASTSTTPKTVTPTESPERQQNGASQKINAESKLQHKAKELNDFYASYKERDTKTLRDILEKVTELKKLIELQRTNFASDVQSLKTLLLGHEKFAAPPVIPAWQMPEKPKEAIPSGEGSPEERKDGTEKTKAQGNKGTVQNNSESVKKKGEKAPKNDQLVQKNGEPMQVNGVSAAK